MDSIFTADAFKYSLLEAEKEIAADIEKKRKEASMMDQLLYGYYYEKDCDNEHWIKVPYEVGDWLDSWRVYVKDKKGSENSVWTLREHMNSWEAVKGVMQLLESIKKEDSDLFYEIFSSNFVSCFLYEIVYSSRDIPLDERRIKTLAKWVQKNKGQELSATDFWRVLEDKLELDVQRFRYILFDTSIQYSKLWRICCKKPIYLSMKNATQKRIYDTMRDSDLAEFREMLEEVLSFCDGVVDNERLKEPCL